MSLETYRITEWIGRVSVSLLVRRSTRDVPLHLTLDDVSGRCWIEQGEGRYDAADTLRVQLGDLSIVINQVLSSFIDEHGWSFATLASAGSNETAHSRVPEEVEDCSLGELVIACWAGTERLTERRVAQLLGLAMGKQGTAPPGASPLEMLWALCPPDFAVRATPGASRSLAMTVPRPAANPHNHKPGCFQERKR